MKRDLTCIICPRGCMLHVESTDSGLQVTGNSCKNGKEYAITECTRPMRTVTSVANVTNRTDRMVSVKTSAPIPKENMCDVMQCIRNLQVQAPVVIGQILLENVYGANIIATKNID